MGQLVDLTGQKFNRLLVIRKVERPSHVKSRSGAYWLCKCDCGKYIKVEGRCLNKRGQQSCGCLSRENFIKRVTFHGESETQLYQTWQAMKARCLNENSQGYKHWGGRGIKICDEWLEYIPFRDWALVNGYKAGLSIDRIENDGNYCPSNCQWLTRSENASKDQQGEKSSSAKLTEEEVIIIRKIGNRIKQKYLASFFDIDRSNISSILNYKTWKHVIVEGN